MQMVHGISIMPKRESFPSPSDGKANLNRSGLCESLQLSCHQLH